MPWTEIYAKEISKLSDDLKTMNRPSLLEVESELRTVKRVSWGLSISLTLFLIILFPLIMVNFGDFDVRAFKFWIIIGQIFLFASFLYSFMAPFIEYLYEYLKNYKKKALKIEPSDIPNVYVEDTLEDKEYTDTYEKS
jgi:hypothetical protein